MEWRKGLGRAKQWWVQGTYIPRLLEMTEGFLARQVWETDGMGNDEKRHFEYILW